MIFICGYYEGYDEWIWLLVIDEVLFGDYVLIGGELGVMVMIDVMVWFLLGVFGNLELVLGDFFLSGFLEYL